MRSNNPKHFFSKKEREAIQAAIREAEAKTSGEIRVHIQRDSSSDILSDAKQAFEKLGMLGTQERSGVLIIFGIQNRRFAIIGDQGINERIPENFWQNIVEIMQKNFRDDRFADGMAEGIRLIGEKLQDYFPAHKGDVNELPNSISYGRL